MYDKSFLAHVYATLKNPSTSPSFLVFPIIPLLNTRLPEAWKIHHHCKLISIMVHCTSNYSTTKGELSKHVPRLAA